VRLQRIRRVFPWRTAVLLGMLLSMPALAFSAWLVWAIEPLQSYYLIDYWQCSKVSELTGSASEIRWLVKTAPGRTSLPAIPSDVTTGKAGNLSIHLSLTARNCGWVGLEKSAPDQVRSAELEDLFRRYIYGGLPYSSFIGFPLLAGFGTSLVIVAFIGFTMKAELWREWQRLWSEVIAAYSSEDEWWDAPPIRYGISERILPRKWMGKVRSKLADWTSRSSSNPTIDKTATPPACQSRSLPSSVNPRPADFATKPFPEPAAQFMPKNPMQEQSIFPGARRANGVQQEQVIWDESQWID
jgi:hypothetical protein